MNIALNQTRVNLAMHNYNTMLLAIKKRESLSHCKKWMRIIQTLEKHLSIIQTEHILNPSELQVWQQNAFNLRQEVQAILERIPVAPERCDKCQSEQLCKLSKTTYKCNDCSHEREVKKASQVLHW